LRSLAVFCGSNDGNDPLYRAAAVELGRELARHRVRLIFGGGSVGLMGALADAALADGGEVVGVIPRFLLDREVGHREVSEMRVVESMHERKATIAELADGFAALPGGIGTLEEIFEIWTWAQLGLHAKPCALLNVGGYFDPLIAFLDRMAERGFVSARQRAVLQVVERVEALLPTLRAAPPPPAAKWTREASERLEERG